MPPVTDDSGKPCKLVRLSYAVILKQTFFHKRWIRDPLMIAENKAFGGRDYAVVLLTGIPLAIVWLFTTPWIPTNFMSDLPDLIVFMIVFLVLAASALWMMQGWVRAPRAQLIIEHKLAAAQCPACNYPLANLNPDDDHRVTCPECSAAWHAERIGRAIRVDIVDDAEENPSN